MTGLTRQEALLRPPAESFPRYHLPARGKYESIGRRARNAPASPKLCQGDPVGTVPANFGGARTFPADGYSWLDCEGVHLSQMTDHQYVCYGPLGQCTTVMPSNVVGPLCHSCEHVHKRFVLVTLCRTPCVPLKKRDPSVHTYIRVHTYISLYEYIRTYEYIRKYIHTPPRVALRAPPACHLAVFDSGLKSQPHLNSALPATVQRAL